MFFTSISVVLGLWALLHNGVSHNMSFSSFVATTRNSTMDRIFAGESLGAEPMKKSTLAHELKFGMLQRFGKAKHMGFGLVDEVVTLRTKGASLA